MRVTLLAGGVGGARMAAGMAANLPPGHLTVIVNTGDDFEHLGLKICPDIDTVCYTLAGMENPVTGWGRQGDTYQAIDVVANLGGPAWFLLGDLDLGVHLERTRRCKAGNPLSRITQDFCRAWGITTKVLPMTDDNTPTWVYTDDGKLSFQEYFVHQRCMPKVIGFEFENIEHSKPAPGVCRSLDEADFVIICPSNPFVSIDPILHVPGIKEAVKRRPVVAVSPLIAGKTVKGPAAKMFAELGLVPSSLEVARHYGDLLDGFVIDRQDQGLSAEFKQMGIDVGVLDILMKTPEDRARLASEVLAFCARIMETRPKSSPPA